MPNRNVLTQDTHGYAVAGRVDELGVTLLLLRQIGEDEAREQTRNAAADQLCLGKPDRSSRLRLAVVIVPLSQTASPSSARLASSRRRSRSRRICARAFRVMRRPMKAASGGRARLPR